MKRKKTYAYSLLFIGIMLCLPGFAQYNFKMEGIVKQDGKAVPAATVSIYNGAGKIKDVFTNSNGAFSFSLKPNDEYNIYFTKNGFSKSEIVVSTMGFSEEDDAKIKGLSRLEIELFELPDDAASVSKIKEILSTPLLSYYYDFDKKAIVSDESLEESLKDELSKIEKILGLAPKKVDNTAELQEKYKNEIIEGDKQFKVKNYEMASLSYQNASNLKPDENYPKSKLAEIERIKTSASEKELALAAEKERLAKEKELKDAAEKERLAKEKAAADKKAEADRIAKEKAIADAAEKNRSAKEKADAAAAEKLRIANEKAMADAAEKERLAKEKELKDAAEKERIAKEKAEADRLAKEKAITDEAERARIAKEKAIADAAEKERLAKEEEKRILNKKYTLAINTGDSSYVAKNYSNAKIAYNRAIELKPAEDYPKGRIEQIDLEIAKSGEFKNELAQKYPEGITEEIIKEGNATVTRRIVVIGNKGYLYIMRQTGFGTYYFKDDAAISEAEFKKNTETK